MATAYEAALEALRACPRKWVVTGVAGFIGSHLLEVLLKNGQSVTGLDNLETGSLRNLDEVRSSVDAAQWRNFQFQYGDIRDLAVCRHVVRGAEFVLHEAALGSVGRSMQDPVHTNETNVSGFLNMLVACRDVADLRFVYAASSSTYGDHAALPKVEGEIGRAQSPYAVTKHVNELYADVFARSYGSQSIGLRYFNVFGPRQNPEGSYAAVIPAWIAATLDDRPVNVHGDGTQTRDFCYIDNVVQANILAAMSAVPAALNQVYNVAVGQRTSLMELLEQIQSIVLETSEFRSARPPQFGPCRAGDVPHSEADIRKIEQLLSYTPTHTLCAGLRKTISYYAARTSSRASIETLSA